MMLTSLSNPERVSAATIGQNSRTGSLVDFFGMCVCPLAFEAGGLGVWGSPKAG